MKDYKLAIEDCSKAIEIDPKYPQAYYNRGLAYKRTGKYDLAIKDYKQTVIVDPKFFSAYYNISCFYSTIKKNKRKALDYLRKAVENGFTYINHIKKDKELDFIRNEKEFKKILGLISKKD